MSLPLPRDRDLWRVIDRVRDRSYDLFTFAEKKRMHDLVCRLKATRRISSDDLQWLRQSDENLCGVAVLSATFSRRRRWNGGAS
jgi:hypothetical protein